MSDKTLKRSPPARVGRRRSRKRHNLAATHAVVFVPVVVPLPITPLPFDLSQWREALDELIAAPKEMFASDQLDIRRPTVFRFTETQSDEFRTLNRIGYVVGLKALRE